MNIIQTYNSLLSETFPVIQKPLSHSRTFCFTGTELRQVKSPNIIIEDLKSELPDGAAVCAKDEHLMRMDLGKNNVGSDCFLVTFSWSE